MTAAGRHGIGQALDGRFTQCVVIDGLRVVQTGPREQRGAGRG